MNYSAFISYSHAVDGRLAPALQAALQAFAKPWYRLRLLRVFRDKTSLSLTPELWPSIERALSESGRFILLASPQAAASPWVQRELEFWLSLRRPDTLYLVLTDGELAWDKDRSDFDWDRTSALPPMLAQRLPQEPLWLDLRWARSVDDVSLHNPRFRDDVATLAAALLERPKDEIVGEDVRQHRRTKRLAWSAATALVALTIVSLGAAYVAVQQRREAEQQRREAEQQQRIAEERRRVAVSRQLAAQALNQVDLEHDLALLLAVESSRTDDTPESRASLLASLQRFPYVATWLRGHSDAINAVALSPDGNRARFGRLSRVSLDAPQRAGDDVHRRRDPSVGSESSGEADRTAQHGGAYRGSRIFTRRKPPGVNWIRGDDHVLEPGDARALWTRRKAPPRRTGGRVPRRRPRSRLRRQRWRSRELGCEDTRTPG